MNSSAYMEFSAWNVPVSEDTIPSHDMWLFDEPFRVSTSLTELQGWLVDFLASDRVVMCSGRAVPVNIVIKSRVVTKSPWVIV